MISGHGGNVYELARRLGCNLANIIDMSSNINPLGPPSGLLDYLQSNICQATRLPEVDSAETVKHFAEFLDIDANRLLAGNGTTQFIYSIPQVLKTRRALIAGPTYADYADACNLHHVPTTILMSSEADDFQPDLRRLESSLADADTVFLCNPNNPTGAIVPGSELIKLCKRRRDIQFVVDESYLPFIDSEASNSLIGAELENVIVLLSISKIFAIPGLRIGFILASAGMIEKFGRYLWPWSVNCFAHTAVKYLTMNKNSIKCYIDQTRQHIQSQQEDFIQTLKPTGRIKLYPSKTPFILARLPHKISAEYTGEHLSQKKILIRNCANFAGLSDRFIRISLKDAEANRMLTQELNSLVTNFNKPSSSFTDRRRAIF